MTAGLMVSRDWVRQAIRWGGMLLVLATAVIGWQQLAALVHGGSERFYLMVLPTAAALYLVWVQPTRRQLLDLWRPLAFNMVLAAMLLVIGAVYLALSKVALHRVPDLFTAREFLPVLYFFLSLQILLVGLYAVLKRIVSASVELANGSIFLPLVGQPRRETLCKLLGGVLLIMIAGPILLGMLFVHRPKIANPYTPAEYERSFEAVEFTSADELRLPNGAEWAAEGETSRTLFICHGLACSKSYALRFLQVADRLNANALLFDFRGHGESDGHTISFGYREKQDVQAAVAYLRNQRPEASREVFGLGISMGTAALTLAAAELEQPLDGVILDSPFANAEDMVNQLVPVPERFKPWCAQLGVASATLHAGCPLLDVKPEECIDRIRAPLLIIHSRGDSLIPVSHADRLFERAAEPKRMWVSSCNLHTFALLAEQDAYLEQVDQLFVDHRSGSDRIGPLVHVEGHHAR